MSEGVKSGNAGLMRAGIATQFPRTAGGRFLPGQSGNPGGRPKQWEDLKKMIIEKQLPKVEALLDLIYERAMAGDVVSAAMFLRTCLPGPVVNLSTDIGRRRVSVADEIDTEEVNGAGNGAP